MKRLVLLFSCSLLLAGCGTTSTQVAANTETVAVPTVDAAMHTWATWCYATNATASQINDVSNAYTAYVNSQLIASNILAYASVNTNTSVNITNIIGTVQSSASALVNIINLYTGK